MYSTLLTDFNNCGVPETLKSDTFGNKRTGGHKIRVEVDGHPKGKRDGKRRCGKRHAFRRIRQGRWGKRREGGERGSAPSECICPCAAWGRAEELGVAIGIKLQNERVRPF